jgi:phosphate-selective porin OprO/OprP
MRNLRCGVSLVGIAAACSFAIPSVTLSDDGALLDAAALFSGNGGAEGAAPAVTPAASTEEPKPIAGYDKGFFLQSKDGKFRLNFNGRIQARYTYFGKDEHQASGGRDESYFELERARLGFSGHLFDPALKYKVEIDAETDGSDKGALTDAHVQYAPRAEYAFGVGQFKPAFLRQEYTSSSKLQRVERSLANEFFNIDRNVGVWVEGLPAKQFYYNFAITNGIDTVNQAPGGGARNGTRFDQPPAFVGKLDIILSGDQKYGYEEADLKAVETPLAVVGVSGLHETYNGTHEATDFVNTNSKVYSFGLDGAFKYQGFSILAEYVGRWWDVDDDDTGAIYNHGFTVQGGIFVVRKPDIELTARYSAIYGNEGANDGDGHEVGPGINWYFSGSHNGKLQLDVAYVDISEDLPIPTELLRRPNTFESTAAGFSAGEQGVLTRVQVQLSF